jgi:hypothetical protein
VKVSLLVFGLYILIFKKLILCNIICGSQNIVATIDEMLRHPINHIIPYHVAFVMKNTNMFQSDNPIS